MKILIHSNAPHVSTGYGVQTAYLAERLRDAGHDVAVSSTYGQQGKIGMWRGIKLYPCGYEMNGNDVVHNHALHHFDGDPRGGWIITLLDVWCLVNPGLADFNVAAWTPIDHDPIPLDIIKFFHRTDAVPVAMSRFGEQRLLEAGLPSTYIPLAVDTQVFKPTWTVQVADKTVTGRQIMGVPDDVFVVGMVAMNKDPNDRKGFNEAFRAFGQFWRRHPNSVMYCHSDWPGLAGGLNLEELAVVAGIPEHAIVFPDLYAYKFGFSPEQMAAIYTAFDVLLAPSHGEGFGVPLIEAQACGTPVITTDFTAQAELVGAGLHVTGQLIWDQPQHSNYLMPYIADVLEKLETIYAADLQAMSASAVAFGEQYDANRVFDNFWQPFLDTLDAEPEPVPLERSPIPRHDAVAVLVPALHRPENVGPLVESFRQTTDGDDASLYFVVDADDSDEIAAIEKADGQYLTSDRGSTFAQKINSGVGQTSEPWVFVSGDDVRFRDGWLDEARNVSDAFDVIGTNDTTGDPKNLDVASGKHADHFFIRRAYIDTYGACLDGPGVLAPEAYRHWFCDKEIIELAKARGVFAPCLESVIVHHHPGYDGREDLRAADPTYMRAVEHGEADRKTWMSRIPLVQMQRTSRGKR